MEPNSEKNKTNVIEKLNTYLIKFEESINKIEEGIKDDIKLKIEISRLYTFLNNFSEIINNDLVSKANNSNINISDSINPNKDNSSSSTINKTRLKDDASKAQSSEETPFIIKSRFYDFAHKRLKKIAINFLFS